MLCAEAHVIPTCKLLLSIVLGGPIKKNLPVHGKFCNKFTLLLFNHWIKYDEAH